MALAIYFHPKSMNAAQYDEVQRRLDAAGAGRPAGRVHHSCFGTGDSMMVYDVWESQEAFDAFGVTLMPILESMNLDPGTPDVMPIHRVIQ